MARHNRRIDLPPAAEALARSAHVFAVQQCALDKLETAFRRQAAQLSSLEADFKGAWAAIAGAAQALDRGDMNGARVALLQFLDTRHGH